MNNKETLSDKQYISIIILFFTGSNSIFVMGLEAKKDAWLAFILAILITLPMVLIYTRLHTLFPGKDLFDILEICFGKFVGKLMILLYTWFVFYFVSDILVTYSFFINVVNLHYTPTIILNIFLAILCAFGVKKGLTVLGRWSESFVIVPIITLLTIVLLSIPNMKINNILPILQDGIKPILKGTFSTFTFPLIQIVVFTMAFSNFETPKSPYKIYIKGLLISGVYLSILSITNILVLGVNTAGLVYYPAFATISKIVIGDILQRIDILIVITFILGGFVKISILLLCICKGITKLFGYQNYKFIIIPIALLVINLSYFQYDSVMHYFNFNIRIWPYYHFPFQVIFPIITLITAEVKKKKLKNI
ncbi:endospore germination permease [Clostridium aestuarii]|uniref:Endospore germination permease n=1 Tax=Clostridium aestuarii TaxID=338193 RepID=A0ABT4CVA8_9CLOT|nr:endospore germination permease [Clostridium aestuarii]MCY6482901.1 endospore germination permease [Clostridium aestuarii]